MEEKHLWDREEARRKIQEWYDDLKVKFNDPSRRKEIKDKYNDDSLIFERVSQKARIGRRAALKHWQDAFRKFDKIEEIVIVITSLVPPDPGIPSRNLTRTGDQKVTWNGTIVFTKKGRIAESTHTFQGIGWHIEPCFYGNPDYEDFPW